MNAITDEKNKTILERTAMTCPVFLSLNPEIEKRISTVEVADREVADRAPRCDRGTDLTGDPQHLGADEPLGERGERLLREWSGSEP